MRAFIALELPEGFEDELAALARLLEEQVEGRFMKRDTYHITLAFLGEVDEAGRMAAVDAMDAALATYVQALDGGGGASAPGGRAIPLRCDGLGKFGRANDATLWLGLQRTQALETLANCLREQLQARGVPFDPKPFRPHITLARRARIPKGQLPSLPFPQPASAGNVTLFKSELSHEGATYKPLYTIDLSMA